MCKRKLASGAYCKRPPKNGYCWQHAKLGCKSAKNQRSAPSDPGPMTLLPDELRLEILGYLSPAELLNACQTDRTMASVGRDEALWERLYRERFGKTKADESTWYDRFKAEHASEIEFRKLTGRKDKFDRTKTWAQNLDDYNSYELVYYRYRPFIGPFRKSTLPENRKSAFENQGSAILATRPVTLASPNVAKKPVVYVILQKGGAIRSPVFATLKATCEYRKSHGWVLGGRSGHYLGIVQNYLGNNRIDLAD